MVRTPPIDALLQIDWKGLATSGVCDHAALKKVDDETWEWCEECPSCYDFLVDPVQPMVPEDFKESPPPVIADETIEIDAKHTDSETGLVVGTKRVSMRVISCDAALSREEEQRLFFRAADPPEHDNYYVMWRPHPIDEEEDEEVERWQLIRTTGWDNDEPKALSLIRWNPLKGIAEGTSDHELGAALIDCVRGAAGFHRRRTGSGAESSSEPARCL